MTGSHVPIIAVPEHSAVGESASNARAERTVQMVENQQRVCETALESGLGAKVSCNHPVTRWLAEHCADIMNRISINKTGMPPCDELHGKKAIERRGELGEIVYYSTPKEGRAKLDLRWKVGVYLGHAWDSNGLFVGNTIGDVKKACSAVRVVEGAEQTHKSVQRVIGKPGNGSPIPDGEPTEHDIAGAADPQDLTLRMWTQSASRVPQNMKVPQVLNNLRKGSASKSQPAI